SQALFQQQDKLFHVLATASPAHLISPEGKELIRRVKTLGIVRNNVLKQEILRPRSLSSSQGEEFLAAASQCDWQRAALLIHRGFRPTTEEEEKAFCWISFQFLVGKRFMAALGINRDLFIATKKLAAVWGIAGQTDHFQYSISYEAFATCQMAEEFTKALSIYFKSHAFRKFC